MRPPARAVSKSKRIPEAIPGLGVLVSFEQVYYQGARHRDLVNYIEQFPLHGLLGMLSGIAAILHNSPDPTPFQLQTRFAREFAHQIPRCNRILEILQENRDGVLVHDEQLAVLIKYAILYARGEEWPAEASGLLIRLLLVYNSLHGREFEPKSGDFDSFLRFELRNVFNLEEHLGRVIARYSEFFEWARTSESAARSKNRMDLDCDFVRLYGITYEEWAASAFTILAYFRQITSAKVLETTKPLLNLSAYLANFTADAPIWKWLDLNTIPLEEARALFEKESATPSYSGVTLLPFMRRPLLSVTDEHVCAPYLPYLENSLGAGIFFAFLDGYNNQPNKSKTERKAESDRFTRYFGEFFEHYMVETLRASHPRPELVFGERTYVTEEGTEGVATDLVVFEGDTALFIDICASRFNVVRSLIELDDDFIRKDIEKIVLANAEQLDKSIRAFKAGRLTYPGVDVAQIERIFPIVLTIQPMPRAFALNRHVLQEIERRALLRDIERLEILTAEDAEGLPALYYGGVLLSDILARKTVHQHPKAQNDSLKNYLFHFEPHTLRKATKPPQGDTKVPWFDRVMDLVKVWLSEGVRDETSA